MLDAFKTNGSSPPKPDLRGEDSADISVENHGSVFLISPQTTKGEHWISENVNAEPRQYFGRAVACEPRYVSDIVRGAIADGLRVR